MPGLKTRRGAGLAEMIVALTLAAIVAAAGATALANTERYMRRARTTADARRTLREAAAVLATELRAAPSDSVFVRGDTAVDFLGIVGESVVCVSSGLVVVLPPDSATTATPYSSWRALPEAGDLMAVFDTADGGAWRSAVVDSASTRADGAGCTPASGLVSASDSAARRPVTRVVLRSTFAIPVLVGAPARVLRGGRYALTRAADRSWSLSYRRCTPSCGTAQPVAGPLAAPTDSGLIFIHVAGDPRVDVSLRVPPVDLHAPRESTRLLVALRNRDAGRP